MNELDYTRYTGDRGELNFEDDLVTELLKAGWGSRKTILKNPTEQDLVDNFRRIVNERNNLEKSLNGYELTNYEFDQIMNKISFINSPVEANRFLAGREIIIHRDNKEDMLHYGQDIFINLFEPNTIAGGDTVYQIAEQPLFGTDANFNDRRGDVSLLINGIPVIHLELKSAKISIEEAEEQLKKYAREGAFKGLYKLVQVFFAMNAREAVYFANPGAFSRFNPAFFFHWADRENNIINDFRELCNGKYSILSIPNAHQLVGYYTIADRGDNTLKVMRPYQYWAIRSVVKKVSNHVWGEKDQLGGFFWGTTGCGKTACMYKTGWIIVTRNMADKVIYLVDRTELNNQTLDEYRNFAYDDDTINDTDRTKDLQRLLTSNRSSSKLIITSIQKMNLIAKELLREDKKLTSQLNAKNIVFIVDEAHRSEFGDMHRNIKDAFPYALFFGFTGTPIFDENSKYTEKDHSKNTTETLFGEALAVYSIADGIRDENVLGFDPGAVKTYADNDLRQEVAFDKVKTRNLETIKANPKLWSEYQRIVNLPMSKYKDKEGNLKDGIEDLLPNGQYNNDKHRRAVVQDIKDHWDERSYTGKIHFHAIFATASIEEAIEYYKLFKEMTDLKVTALFDPHIDNREKSIEKEDAILEIVSDYGEMFDQYFDRKTDPQLKRFKQDVSMRLAHKGHYVDLEKKPEDCIDILIVVDQMLTGYDSKWVNTLYADKVMKSDMLIQAISRTNRIFNKETKPFGIFRFYRKCYTMQKNLEDALRLYCQGDTASAKVDDIHTNIERMNELYAEAKQLFEDNKAEPIFDFFRLPDDEEDRKKFRRIFEEISTRKVAIRAQGYVEGREYTDDDGVVHSLDMGEKDYKVMSARYNDLKSAGKGGGKQQSGFGFDLDTYLSNIDIANIDYHYLESHFEQLKITLASLDVTEDERDLALDRLRKELGILSSEDREIAEIIIAGIRDRSIPIEDKTLREYIDEYKKKQNDAKIDAIVLNLGCDRTALCVFLEEASLENINHLGLFESLKATVDIEKAKEFFGESSNFMARVKTDQYLRGLLEE